MSSQPETPEGFSEAWLTLREPADHAARAQSITQQLSVWARQKKTLTCMELGAGTGSNLRFLCPLLGHDQRWLLVDNDPILLNHLPVSISAWAARNNISCQNTSHELVLKADNFSARISWVQRDLAQNLPELPFRDHDLVCASALLDLTSATWLEQLASQCINHQCGALFVLNYNGQIDWQRPIKEDKLMNELLNAHQLGDKG
ncbi:MAG: class I SAM-dependent methyltransferase, partial [Granulosicoccus sp.]